MGCSEITLFDPGVWSRRCFFFGRSNVIPFFSRVWSGELQWFSVRLTYLYGAQVRHKTSPASGRASKKLISHGRTRSKHRNMSIPLCAAVKRCYKLQESNLLFEEPYIWIKRRLHVSIDAKKSQTIEQRWVSDNPCETSTSKAYTSSQILRQANLHVLLSFPLKLTRQQNLVSTRYYLGLVHTMINHAIFAPSPWQARLNQASTSPKRAYTSYKGVQGARPKPAQVTH